MSSKGESDVSSNEKKEIEKMTEKEIEDLIVFNKEQVLGFEKNNEILLREIRRRGVDLGAEKVPNNEHISSAPNSDPFKGASAPVSTAIVNGGAGNSSLKSESDMAQAIVHALQKSNIVKNPDDSFIPMLWGNLEDDKGNPTPGPAAFFSAVERSTKDPERRLYLTYKKSAGVARSILDAMMANEVINYNDAKTRLTQLCGTGLTERET